MHLALLPARDIGLVSIHLREWGALHPEVDAMTDLAVAVSIHLREWGAMHLTESNLRWAAAYRFNSSS